MKPPSQSQIAANRANSAKSTGPITPSGKLKVSQNARKHGLTARQVLLPGESEVAYEYLFSAYIDQFQPTTPLEFELVSVMVAARWRHRRLTAIETGLYNKELAEPRKEIERHDLTPDERVVRAFDNLCLRSLGFSALVRHDAALSRAHDRAFRQLEVLRKESPLTKQSQFRRETKRATPDESAT
jgi:hypothetical protein